MGNAAKLVLVALVAVMCVDALAATSASAEEPLFVTASLRALLFTGTIGAVTLRAKQAGVEGTITCEKTSVHGRALNKSALARELHIEFKGKCEQIVGANKAACTEPIKPLVSYGELGFLLLNDSALLLVAPEKGTEFVEVRCGSNITKFSGAVIGEFPVSGRDGIPQLGTLREAFLLSFKAKGTAQEPEEIELLGSSMKNLRGVSLKAEGFFGEKASEETAELLLFSGLAEIQDMVYGLTATPTSCHFTRVGQACIITVENLSNVEVLISDSRLEGENATNRYTLNAMQCARGAKLGPVGFIDSKCTAEVISRETGVNWVNGFHIEISRNGIRQRAFSVSLLQP